MGVIVKKDNQSNRYYLHEVITENIVEKKDSTSSLDGTSALTGDLDTVLNVESSIDNISQTSKNSRV